MLTISLAIACSRYIYNGVILHAHPVRGESHNQHNATEEVATTSPPFYNEPQRSHVLCVKAELGTTSTSWSQHHFVAIGNPERHVHKASHRGSKQQQRSCSQSLLLLLARATYTMVLFFTHISVVLNHTINTTPPERLQQYIRYKYGAPFVKILSLTDLAQKLVSLRIFSYLCTEIAISACI